MTTSVTAAVSARAVSSIPGNEDLAGVVSVFEPIRYVNGDEWRNQSPTVLQESLESGQVLFFPEMSFELNESEQVFVGGDYAHPQSKNISYLRQTGRVRGVPDELAARENELQSMTEMLSRFSQFAQQLLCQICDSYKGKA